MILHSSLNKLSLHFVIHFLFRLESEDDAFFFKKKEEISSLVSYDMKIS